MRHWVVLMLFLVALGALRVVGCGEPDEEEGCEPYWVNKCEGVVCPPDDNECTGESCDSATGNCTSAPLSGPSCIYDGLSGVCINGRCREDPCVGVVCDDGLECTRDECYFRNGDCFFTNLCDDGNPCTEDICNPLDGLCVFPYSPDGSPCDLQATKSTVVVVDGICLLGECVKPPP